jgi:hypothetical protein
MQSSALVEAVKFRAAWGENCLELHCYGTKKTWQSFELQLQYPLASEPVLKRIPLRPWPSLNLRINMTVETCHIEDQKAELKHFFGATTKKTSVLTVKYRFNKVGSSVLKLRTHKWRSKPVDAFTHFCREYVSFETEFVIYIYIYLYQNKPPAFQDANSCVLFSLFYI